LAKKAKPADYARLVLIFCACFYLDEKDQDEIVETVQERSA